MTEGMLQYFQVDGSFPVYFTEHAFSEDNLTFCRVVRRLETANTYTRDVLPSKYRETDLSTPIVRELIWARDRIR